MSRQPAAHALDAPFPRRGLRVDRERHDKLRQLRLQGREPFPDVHLPSRSLAAAIYASHDPRMLDPGEHKAWRYVVAGRLVARRKHRHAIFLDLRDQSGVIELCATRDRLDDAQCSQLLNADIGDIVAAEGIIYVTDNHKLALSVLASRLLTKALRSPPARSNGAAATEVKYRQQELDLLANEETRTLFKARSCVTAALRECMTLSSFIEVDGSNRLYLRRCLLGGLERVYQLGKCFRDDHGLQQHDPELTMLEWSAAYIDYREAARKAEEIIQYAAASSTPEMRVLWHGHFIDLSGPWRTTTVQESIIEQCGLDILAADAPTLARRLSREDTSVEENSWGALASELYTTFVEPKLIQPTIVYDHPLAGQALVKRHPIHDQLAGSFRVVIGGSELASGESELNDPYEQWARLIARESDDGLPFAHRDQEVRLLEYGLCPAASARLHADRLIMLLTGSDTVRDVIPLSLLTSPR